MSTCCTSASLRRPCKERARSCSPATQPSVWLRMVARVEAESSRSNAACRKWRASAASNCRSAARSSQSSPCARSRGSGRKGSERTRAGPKGGITGLEGCQHSREEAQRVVVLRIQGQPGGGHSALSQKLRQQRGFPEAGRGTQQDEGLLQTLPEALDEASAMNQPGRRAGHVEPGGQQRAERIVRHGDLHNWWPFHDGERPGP